MKRALALAAAIGFGLAVYWLWPDEPPSSAATPRPARSSASPPAATVDLPPATPAPTTDEDPTPGTVPNGQNTYHRSFTLRIEDPEHRPLASARVARPPGYLGGAAQFLLEEPLKPGRRREPVVQTLCTSDGDGRCAFTVNEECQACTVDVRVTNPGFGQLDVSLNEPEATVTLAPERRLTVHLDAPGSALLSPLTVQVIPDGESGQVDAAFDSAGSRTFEQLRAVPITVKLVDQIRAIATVEAPLGVDEVTLTAVPRRLDVQVELGRPVTNDDLCRVVDLRCGKQPRLLRQVTQLGTSALHARFEYAPEGPCRVAVSLDCSRSINTAGAPVDVTAPTAVTLRP